MNHPRLLHPCLAALLCGIAEIHAIDSAALEQALCNPAQWRSEEFTALWKRDPMEAGAPVTHARFESPPEIFGLKPESVSATFAGDDVHSVSVVVLDAGIFFGFANSNLRQGESLEKAKARFEEEFSARKAKALDGLKKLRRRHRHRNQPEPAGRLETPGQHPPLRQRCRPSPQLRPPARHAQLPSQRRRGAVDPREPGCHAEKTR